MAIEDLSLLELRERIARGEIKSVEATEGVFKSVSK